MFSGYIWKFLDVCGACGKEETKKAEDEKDDNYNIQKNWIFPNNLRKILKYQII